MNLWEKIYIMSIQQKFIYSEKASKFCKISTVDLTGTTLGQIYGGDFAKFCGLLRIYEFWLQLHNWGHTIQGKINKKINRSTSAWKTLSLNRKDKVKNDNSQIFRSPSIYENNPSNNSSAGDQNPDIENNHDMTASDVDENKQQNTVMNRYLSGKFCPLTPSQQPTNVSHLVEANEKGPAVESGAGGPGGGGGAGVCGYAWFQCASLGLSSFLLPSSGWCFPE